MPAGIFVHPCGGFIEKENLAVGEELSGQSNALPLSHA